MGEITLYVKAYVRSASNPVVCLTLDGDRWADTSAVSFLADVTRAAVIFRGSFRFNRNSRLRRSVWRVASKLRYHKGGGKTVPTVLRMCTSG